MIDLKKGTEISIGEEELRKISDGIILFFPSYVEFLEARPNRKYLDWDLCSSGKLSEKDLLSSYAKATGLLIVEEEDLTSSEKYPGLPQEFLNNWNCFPYRWDDGKIEIAISDPYCINELAYYFKKLLGKDAYFTLARRSHLERLIHGLYSAEAQENKDDFALTGDLENEETLRSLASEARIVRLVNEMFSRAAEMDASDIHVEPDEKKLAIRFRIDGILQEIMTPPLSLYPAIASRIKLVGNLNIAERRLPQDGRTDLQLGKSIMDVRISTMPSMNGESIVLRILRKDTVQFSLQSIGMGAGMIEQFQKLIELPYGIILVVGPTGSGKSTTLYSVLTQLNLPDRKIITIEDPVEYRTEGITQIQVNSKIGLDFANGLRHIVRQDPDIILVGEIRDKDTAEIAIHASLTGHLVFSTLHTNDAPGAVSRLLDMGVESFLIASSLSGVLSQRLVRKICKVCNGQCMTDNTIKCKNCNGSGYKGRVGIFELMIVNEEIRDLITRRSDSVTIANVAVKNGMKPLIEDGMLKIEQGITTKEEVLSTAMTVLG